MKRRLKGALIGALLSTACIPTLFSSISSYAADGVSFAGGNNSYTSGSYSNSNVAGWGITFNTSGGNDSTRVVGAKISVYYTTDENIIAGASSLSGDALTSYLHQNITSFNQCVNTRYGANDILKSFYIYDDSSYLSNLYSYTPYSHDSYMGNNIPVWIKKTATGGIALGLNDIGKVSQPMATRGILNSSLYNSEVWKISATQRWFVAGSNSAGSYSEKGTGNLPENTKATIAAATEALVDWGGETGIPAGAFAIWFVEPLVSADIEMSNGTWQRVALTPAMMAYYADASNDLDLSLDGWSSTDASGTPIWESYIKVTSTDGLSGNSSYRPSPSSSPYFGDMLQATTNQSYGAYAVAVKPSEIITRDELPSIPSIPVFQKDGEGVSYMGVASTVPSEVWNEISGVLSYAMNLSDIEPVSDLYSYCQSKVSTMKLYADNVYMSEGIYASDYEGAYKILWQQICRYYANTSIELGATTADIPSRISSNQPNSVSAKFGDSTKNTGPFEVGGNLGSIGSNMSLSYQEASFYNLDTALGIVKTDATSTGSLGTKVQSNSLTVGDILKNPYEYSIVVESMNVTGGDAYPEPPNIVVWDEKQGRVDSAFMEVSIDPNTWGTILNTLKYARNDDGVNSLELSSAEEAKKHAEYLNNNSMTDYNSWHVQRMNASQYLDWLRFIEGKMNEGIREIDGILFGCVITDPGSKALQEYGGSLFAYYNTDWISWYPKDTLVYRLQHDSSNTARSDVFQAWNTNEGIRNYTGTMSQVAGYGSWRDCYKSVMADKYYNHYYTWTVKGAPGDNYATNEGWGYVPGDEHNLFYNVNHYSNGSQRWTAPTNGANVYTDYKPYLGALDTYCYWYLNAQKDSYRFLMQNYLTPAKDDVIAEIDRLTAKIDEYDAHVHGFTEQYDETLNMLMNRCFINKLLVDGTRDSTGAVTNNVTQNIYGRGANRAFEGMSKPYRYPAWVLSGTPTQVSYSNRDTSIAYSAYSSNYTRYQIGNITQNCMLDEITTLMQHDGDYNLNFKCRVVKAGDHPGDVMTRDVIVTKASGSCSYKLSYGQIFDQPYSYGIIINSLEMDTTSTEIQEWQVSEYMEKEDLDDSSVWAGWGTGNSPSFTLTNNPTKSVISRYAPSAGKLSWVSGKISGENAPGMATDIMSSAGGQALTPASITVGEATWIPGSYKDTALYKITHNWGGNVGTIDILTAEITSVSSVPHNNNASVVAEENSYEYNHDNTSNSGDNGGTYLSLWKPNGSISIKAVHPMMVSSWSTDTLGWNDHPTKTVSGGSMGNYNVLNNGIGLGVNGYRPEWFHSAVTHTIDSPFNVVITYRSNTTIKTTFSTDKEDTDSMASDITNNKSPIPYLKAGQTFNGGIKNNIITIKGYANIGKNNDFVRNNGLRFKTETEFLTYMNNITDAFKVNAKVEVVSTLNGFNVNSLNQAVVGGENFDVNLTEAGSNVDNDAGVQFKDSVISNPTPVVSVYSGSKLYENAYFRPYGSGYNSYVNGPVSSTLATKTQFKYNDLLNHGLGTTASWYYEYSEALGIAYYEATVTFDDYDFTGTISRYESDAETEADFYVKSQYSSLQNAWKGFGYDTYLMKSDGRNSGDPVNVIATAIDLTDAIAANPDLAELLTNDEGVVISKLLGKQTPIHVRGSVYDNT